MGRCNLMKLWQITKTDINLSKKNGIIKCFLFWIGSVIIFEFELGLDVTHSRNVVDGDTWKFK